MMETSKIFIGLGTNLGDKKKNIDQVVQYIREFVDVISIAPVCETEPMYIKDQPSFLNTVLFGETSLSPRELLSKLQAVESRMGRKRVEKNGPRIIDLDILFY